MLCRPRAGKLRQKHTNKRTKPTYATIFSKMSSCKNNIPKMFEAKINAKSICVCIDVFYIDKTKKGQAVFNGILDLSVLMGYLCECL